MIADRPVVVVVDEHAPTQDLYQRVLGAQYTVTHCARVEDAAAVLQTQLVDVLILEPNFKHDGGWKLLAAVRKHTVTRFLPVIVCSAVDERRRAAEAHVTAYLVKPVAPHLLLDTIQRVLSTRA